MEQLAGGTFSRGGEAQGGGGRCASLLLQQDGDGGTDSCRE
jgi:hypothetical protein